LIEYSFNATHPRVDTWVICGLMLFLGLWGIRRLWGELGFGGLFLEALEDDEEAWDEDDGEAG
jgi:hypothetical protein